MSNIWKGLLAGLAATLVLSGAHGDEDDDVRGFVAQVESGTR
ncbi:MAG: hypothetical protein ACI83N_002169 [Hydrogenophaga sp.]|jgi:hypothetical protein